MIEKYNSVAFNSIISLLLFTLDEIIELELLVSCLENQLINLFWVDLDLNIFHNNFWIFVSRILKLVDAEVISAIIL